MEKLPFILRENKDGSIEINYEDLDTEFFGGGDYEVNYKLDVENTEKLQNKLQELHSGNMRELITAEFGECLDLRSFSATCDEWGIQYELFTWIG